MKAPRTCRKVREALQEAMDRGAVRSKFLPEEVRAHLGHCSACRSFADSLGTLAPLLRNQLDEALRDWQVPEIEVVLQERTGPAAAPDPSTPVVMPRIRRWLFARQGKPARVYRLAALTVLAAVLIVTGVRIYSVTTRQRAIRLEIDRVVEMIYQEPLLTGIESALLRTAPLISDYSEEQERSFQAWLEQSDTQSSLN
jgi:predicted anti-sigma-YlaC factor YlaD